MIVPPVPVVPKSFLGIKVVVDPASRLIADARGFWPFKRIALGTPWFYLPERQRQAVLYHEAAHVRRWHMEKRFLALPLLFLRPLVARALCAEQECEADRFAAEAGLGAELAAVLKKFPPEGGAFYPALDERLPRLMEAIEDFKGVAA